MAPSRNITCFIHLFFFLSPILLLLEYAGNTNPPVKRFMNSCFPPYGRDFAGSTDSYQGLKSVFRFW